MFKMPSEDEILKQKLEKVVDPKLIELIEEAERIREELGDDPEIKSIEKEIVNWGHEVRSLGHLALSCLYYSAIMGIIGENGRGFDPHSMQDIILVLALGVPWFNNLFTAMNVDISKIDYPTRKDVEKRLAALRIKAENKELKEQLSSMVDARDGVENNKEEETGYDRRR